MVFYAYLDPQVITQAFESRPFGYQCLIALLRGFIQNCCVIDWDGRVWSALGAYVQALPRDSDRLMIEKILKFLKDHNRFVTLPCSRPSLELADVMALASEAELDLIITASNDSRRNVPRGVEVCSLASYQFTEFEHRRSSSAQGGSTYRFRELEAQEFLNVNFGKALRYARWIKICDGSLGRNFAENYRYTCERFLKWLRETHVRPDGCTVSFLCGDPSMGPLGTSARVQLTNFLNACKADAKFYTRLPHERFILTDQMAFEIGRGMDFLEPNSGRNRDVSIASKNLRSVTKLLDSYEKFRT